MNQGIFPTHPTYTHINTANDSCGMALHAEYLWIFGPQIQQTVIYLGTTPQTVTVTTDQDFLSFLVGKIL